MNPRGSFFKTFAVEFLMTIGIAAGIWSLERSFRWTRLAFVAASVPALGILSTQVVAWLLREHHGGGLLFRLSQPFYPKWQWLAAASGAATLFLIADFLRGLTVFSADALWLAAVALGVVFWALAFRNPTELRQHGAQVGGTLAAWADVESCSIHATEIVLTARPGTSGWKTVRMAITPQEEGEVRRILSTLVPVTLKP